MRVNFWNAEMLSSLVKKLFTKSVDVNIGQQDFFDSLSLYLKDNFYHCSSLDGPDSHNLNLNQLHIVSSKSCKQHHLMSCKLWNQPIKHESDFVFDLDNDSIHNYLVATTKTISLNMKIRGLIYGIKFIDYPKLAPYLIPQ